MKFFTAICELSLPGGLLISGWWLLCRAAGKRISHRTLRLLGVFLTIRLLFLFPIALTELPWSGILPQRHSSMESVSVERFPAADAEKSVTPAETGPGEKWTGLLFLLWAVGAAAKALALLFGQACCRRRILRWCTLPQEEALRKNFDRMRARLGVGEDCILCVNPGIKSPGLLGLWRKYLILPQEALPEVWQELIFSHELFHLRHRDSFVKLLVSLAGVLYWFHPLFYVLRRNLYEEMELACDEEVLETTGAGRAGEYVRLILQFSGAARSGNVPFHAIGGEAKMLKTRIAAVLRKKAGKSRPLLLAGTALGLFLTIFSEDGLALGILPEDTVFETICPDLSEKRYPFVPVLEFTPDESLSKSLLEILDGELEPVENAGYDLAAGLIKLDTGEITITLYPNQKGYTLAAVSDAENLTEEVQYYLGPLSLYDEINQRILPEYEAYLEDMLRSPEFLEEILEFRQSFALPRREIAVWQ